MSADRDTTRTVRSWLEEGVTELPDRVLDSVLDQLPATHQRRFTWWPARRFPHMNQAMRLALASAAVIAVALLGISVLRGPNVASPAEPDPTSTPSSATIPRSIPNQEEAALDAGTYALSLSGIDVIVDLPDGWVAVEATHLAKNLREPSETGFGVFLVDQAYTHPCQWDGALPEFHPGYEADALADGLANQALRGDAAPTDVTVDGFSGRAIELTVPPDIDFADCDQAEFRSWNGRFHQGPGQHDAVYILDVEGARLVIDAAYLPETSGADRAELEAIVESIQINP